MGTIKEIAAVVGLFFSAYASATFYIEELIGNKFVRYKGAMLSQTLKEKGEGILSLKGIYFNFGAAVWTKKKLLFGEHLWRRE